MDVDKSGTDEVQDANAVAAAFLTRITSRWHEIDGDLLLELRALKEDQKAISRMFCPTAEGIAKGVAWAAEMNEVSRLRRETLLEAEGCGVSTRELADVMHVTLPRVRQLVLEARRKAGLPIDPQYGGRNKRKSDGETRG